MTTRTLEQYVINVEKKTGAVFKIIEHPREDWTNFDGDHVAEHKYIKARLQLVGTKYTTTVVWLNNRWRRGR